MYVFLKVLWPVMSYFKMWSLQSKITGAVAFVVTDLTFLADQTCRVSVWISGGSIVVRCVRHNILDPVIR